MASILMLIFIFMLTGCAGCQEGIAKFLVNVIFIALIVALFMAAFKGND
jgi:hypothetical protein